MTNVLLEQFPKQKLRFCPIQSKIISSTGQALRLDQILTDPNLQPLNYKLAIGALQQYSTLSQGWYKWFIELTKLQFIEEGNLIELVQNYGDQLVQSLLVDAMEAKLMSVIAIANLARVSYNQRRLGTVVVRNALVLVMNTGSQDAKYEAVKAIANLVCDSGNHCHFGTEEVRDALITFLESASLSSEDHTFISELLSDLFPQEDLRQHVNNTSV